MNKISLLLFVLTMTVPVISFSEEVTININANVIERSCAISNDSINANVDLQVGNLKGSKIGIPFAGSAFSISLEDCPENISTAYVTFAGASDPVMGNLLKNMAETDVSANGVALGLYNLAYNNIDIRNNKEILTINHDLIKNTYGFLAYYVRVSDVFSAGKVLSIVDFELAYD
nr:fimbrial protein [Pantoea sp. 201603H]